MKLTTLKLPGCGTKNDTFRRLDSPKTITLKFHTYNKVTRPQHARKILEITDHATAFTSSPSRMPRPPRTRRRRPTMRSSFLLWRIRIRRHGCIIALLRPGPYDTVVRVRVAG